MLLHHHLHYTTIGSQDVQIFKGEGAFVELVCKSDSLQISDFAYIVFLIFF